MTKKKKYSKWIGIDSQALMCLPEDYDYGRLTPLGRISHKMVLHPGISGFVMGSRYDDFARDDVDIGMEKGEEGNIAVIGGNGSGKSACIAKPTLLKWHGPMVVTDIKGELSQHYKKYYNPAVDRPFKVFDPTNPSGYSYDPFELMLHCDDTDIVSQITSIASIVIPDRKDIRDPFWDKAERSLFEAALIHYFRLGLSFSETICRVLALDAISLSSEIKNHGDPLANMFVGLIGHTEDKMDAGIDVGLRGKLLEFADNYILHSFRGIREGAVCFRWSDLERYTHPGISSRKMGQRNKSYVRPASPLSISQT